MATEIDIAVTTTTYNVSITAEPNEYIVNITTNGGSGVDSVTGTLVDNTDPNNPVINTPNIPTKTSDLTNDGENNTSTFVESNELGAVAFSNNYNDLDNKPTIPTPQNLAQVLAIDNKTNDIPIVSNNGNGYAYVNDEQTVIGNDFGGTKKITMNEDSFAIETNVRATIDGKGLELSTTTDGFGLPRLTTTQMNAIAFPTEGMIVWNTTETATYQYNGTVWVLLGGGAVDSVNGQTGVVVLDAADVGAEPTKGSDDNYVTDAQLVVIANTSNTNSGDNATNTKYEAVARTGAVVAFDTDAVYNSIASPSSSNLTDDLTGARLKIVQKIYHNAGTAPTVPAGWVKKGTGNYVTSTLNIIYAEWSVGTTVEYWITQ